MTALADHIQDLTMTQYPTALCGTGSYTTSWIPDEVLKELGPIEKLTERDRPFRLCPYCFNRYRESGQSPAPSLMDRLLKEFNDLYAMVDGKEVILEGDVRGTVKGAKFLGVKSSDDDSPFELYIQVEDHPVAFWVNWRYVAGMR